MGELDTRTWIEAAQLVGRLRRRIWRRRICMFAALLFELPVFAFWHELNPCVRGILFSLSPVAICACLAVGNVAWFRLVEFRCPRCGKWFIAAFGFGYLRNRCKHCNLDLSPAAVAKGKPLDVLEPGE